MNSFFKKMLAMVALTAVIGGHAVATKTRLKAKKKVEKKDTTTPEVVNPNKTETKPVETKPVETKLVEIKLADPKNDKKRENEEEIQASNKKIKLDETFDLDAEKKQLDKLKDQLDNHIKVLKEAKSFHENGINGLATWSVGQSALSKKIEDLENEKSESFQGFREKLETEESNGKKCKEAYEKAKKDLEELRKRLTDDNKKLSQTREEELKLKKEQEKKRIDANEIIQKLLMEQGKQLDKEILRLQGELEKIERLKSIKGSVISECYKVLQSAVQNISNPQQKPVEERSNCSIQ